MTRAFYTLLWWLAMPLVLLRLTWRARRQPDYLRHVAERFGQAPCSTERPIWLHAVSVGETRAAQPLIMALLDRYPDHELLLTHMTPTGRTTGAELFGKHPRVKQSYLPYELPWALRRFLRRAKPQFGIVMETEIWPNLLADTEAAEVPMMLANARLSARSAQGYLRLGRLAHEAVGRFDLIGAQGDADAQRLKNLSAKKIVVTGNMKYDVRISTEMLARGAMFRTYCKHRYVLLAAITRDGEEELLLDAFAQHASAEILLVLVPRHPQRFDDVAQLIERRNLTLARRSQTTDIPDSTQVWLGDSMGEMVAYYRMADVAIIGGSWLPLGGHNLIEACAVGVPVIVGPHTFNFAEAADNAIDAGAALRCTDPSSAIIKAIELFGDQGTRQKMAQAGIKFTAEHGGATERTLGLITEMNTGY
ncbi:MAG TPA: lipid IV(A) 3-deoxy-D-manno-octulosonic acid transferase [Rhodocyclaceae bacterium]|nr:lipid IV(A) 3-deoxy-D-manno-octulosonic acid transferase [Rhodocyclaceae bacterium]